MEHDFKVRYRYVTYFRQISRTKKLKNDKIVINKLKSYGRIPTNLNWRKVDDIETHKRRTQKKNAKLKLFKITEQL